MRRLWWDVEEPIVVMPASVVARSTGPKPEEDFSALLDPVFIIFFGTCGTTFEADETVFRYVP